MRKNIKVLVNILFTFAFFLLTDRTVLAVNYWFNNAVDTSPTTLGNYWLNSGLTTPATTLPNLSSDRLIIVAGSTYVGDPTFISTGNNRGTINGNPTFKDSSFNFGTGIVNGIATFIGSLSENFGVINGTQVRKFTSSITTDLDFTGGDPWTVTADGAIVDVSTATYDADTVFTSENGGEIVYIRPHSYLSDENTIKIVYNNTLDETSVPDTSDFTVRVNGRLVNVSNVDVTSSTVTIDLSENVDVDEGVRLSYEIGSNPIKNLLNKNASEFSERYIPHTLQIGGVGPYHSAISNNKFYTTSGGAGMKVFDLDTNELLATIPISGGAYFNQVGDKIYVTDNANDEVNVINTETDTLVETITVGDGPLYSITAGTKVYIGNLSAGTVSVIDSNTDTVTSTIPTTAATYLAVAGKKVYVANNSSDTVSIVDTDTDTIIATVSTGSTPYALTAVGDKVYVLNGQGQSVTVIDANTDTATNTISVGTNPLYLSTVGNKAYVNNNFSKSVSVIDVEDETVLSTIPLLFTPYGSVGYGDKVYIGSDSGFVSLSVINTVTDEIIETIPVGVDPQRLLIGNDKVYANVSGEEYVAVIDTKKISNELPDLLSFSTSSPDGVYGNGSSINITANFGLNLQAGSEMVVQLNNGSTVTLGDVSGSTLSGSFFVTGRTDIPDLSVKEIISADVTDSTGTYNKTEYNLPSSVGDFEGENSFITRNVGDSKNIEIGNFIDIDVGEKPYQMTSSINGYTYVANQGSNDVTIINTADNSVVDTIPVGEEPYGLATVTIDGTVFIYIANINSDDVSVINTTTNTVVATVNVGVKPYYVAAIGTDVYVTNGASNTVSVIDANTNTVTDTISVGSYPRGIKAYGTDLYVANYGDPNYSGGNYISVIDSNTNTVTDTIILPIGSDGPRGVNVLGDKVYVTNYRSNNVSVIDTSTNEIVDTVDVGAGPRGVLGYNGNVYVQNFDDGTISVIDANTNTVTSTVEVGHSPAGMSVIDGNIYYTSFQDGLVRILEVDTNSVMREQEPNIISGSAPSKAKEEPKEILNDLEDLAEEPKQEDVTQNGCVKDLGGELIRLGSRGSLVSELQEFLSKMMFEVGPVDGIFGPITNFAVKQFQSKNNILSDGIIGPVTKQVIYNSCQ